MNPIITAISEGLTRFDQLCSVMPAVPLEIQLDKLRKTHQIRVTEKGFELPKPPPHDGPIEASPEATRLANYEFGKQWREKNKEREKIKSQLYYQKNRLRINANTRARRAKENASG